MTFQNSSLFIAEFGRLVSGRIVYLETRKPAFAEIMRSTSGIASPGTFLFYFNPSSAAHWFRATGARGLLSLYLT